MQDKIFIDSNIFLYAFSTQDKIKKEIASKLILDENCILSTQVINEVSNIMLKRFNFTNQEIDRFVDNCYDRYEIVNIDKNIFKQACDIRDNYNISYYDSLIISSALNSKSSLLYSEDMQNNLKIETITIKNPFSD